MEKRDANELKEILKARYKKDSTIERLFYPEHPLPLAECYLDLGLIEEKILKVEKADNENARDKSAKDLSAREHFLHEYERIQHIQRKLKIEAILQECKALRKRIYIEGAAGAGKSTLSRFIANEWAHDKAPWNQYEWVFYIRLRDLDPSKLPDDKELLKVVDNKLFVGDGNHLRPAEYEAFKVILQQDPHKVLWILDGYDELNLEIVRCTWWKDLLASNYHLLITSRPGAQLLKTELGINLNLAVLGFNDQQVKKYVSNFFDTKHTPETKAEDASQCLTLLKGNLNLWSLAHTPIQLELLCSSWQEFAKVQDLSLTELYRFMLERLLKRRATNEGLSLQELDRKVLKSRYQDHLAYMEYLAFLGMQSKQIVLQEQQINRAYEILPAEKHKKVNFYKELKAIGLVKRYNNGKQAEFAHLTFQEYFAARFVAKAIKAFSLGKAFRFASKDLLEFIAKTKWDSFYEVMWWFVAGLLGGRAELQQLGLERYELKGGDTNTAEEVVLPKTHRHLQMLQTFFDLLLQEPRAELEAFELPLLAKCLAEAGMPKIMQREAIKLHMQSWLEFYWHSKYSDDLKSSELQYLWQVLKTSPKLIHWVESLLVAMMKMENEYGHMPWIVAEVVSTIGPTASETLQSEILMLMKDKEDDVREAAANAVGSIGPMASAALQAGLLELINDKNIAVRWAVAQAVGALGSTADLRLQAAMLMLMQDEDEFVRQAAAECVSALGPAAVKTIGPAAIEALQAEFLELMEECDSEPLLKGRVIYDSDMLFNAAAESEPALGCASNALQDELLQLLRDEYSEVRSAAAKAAKALGPAVNEALRVKLLELIKNDDRAIRCTAIRAIGELKLGECEELQAGLLTQMKDEEYYVRLVAAYAVGKLRPVASEVLQVGLLVLMQDEDKRVRKAVACAVSTLGLAAKEELQVGLLDLIKDESSGVREAAVYAISSLVFAGKDELQTGLLDLIKDQSSRVREAAAFAISSLGLVANKELQKALLDLIKDKSSSVRKVAAYGIGKSRLVASAALQAELLVLMKYEYSVVRAAAAKAVGYSGSTANKALQVELLALMKDEYSNVRTAAAKAVGYLGWTANVALQLELLNLLKDECWRVCRVAAKVVGAFQSVVDPALQVELLALIKDENNDIRQAAISALAKTKSGLVLLCQEIFTARPSYIPPSRLIVSSHDVVQVNNKGELDCFKLCGTALQNFIHDGERHMLTADCWTLALVRKKPNKQHSIHFFNNLMSHMFLILEGIENGVHKAYKFDLFAVGGSSSQNQGQRCQIKNILMKDYARLKLLQENCYCMVQGISKAMAHKLVENIRRDSEAAERGEIIYNRLGDRVSSVRNNNNPIREHSCVSWCLEKWQEIGLPLNRKWFDAIAVIPTAYLPEPVPKGSKCLVM